MYESGKEQVKRNEKGIDVQATFVHAVIGTVRAETNTPMGGDGGHGGITTITLKDDGTWFDVERTNDILTISATGDAEALILADMLEFAAKSLREQMTANAGR